MREHTNSESQSLKEDAVSSSSSISTTDINNSKEKDSFVKLAMRNMVKKGSTSLFHFFLTIIGVIGALLGLAIAFH